MNGADTAWIIVATALVLLMTLPGLALFYGGLVRARSVLSIFVHCFAIACVASVLWFAAGYSIAFGDANAYWGGLGKAFLMGVDSDSLSGTIPEILFFAFQMTFAIITPALIVGAYAERIGFGFVVIFSGAWMLLCYAPVTHWIWGGGFLSDGGLFGDVGVRDFAGGIVVHQTAGLAALVIALTLGPRIAINTMPHSPVFTVTGAGLLWIGWFGFNGGSQLAADGAAAMALTVTHLSAAAGSLSWAMWERYNVGKTSPVGLVTGTVAGLAAITPASGFVGPAEALAIGAVSGLLCREAVNIIRVRLGVDDSLDVFAVHGVGGIFGTVMIAAFGHGAWAAQIGALAIVGVFTVAVTYALVKIVGLITPMRVHPGAETVGLDIAAHGERAYNMLQ